MIPLYVKDGVAFVWNSKDWYELRTKYRICGPMIGSVPAFPRQNDFQGLPMQLMVEEAAFLVDIGACELYELPKLTEKLSREDKFKLEALETKALHDQMIALKKQRIEQLAQKMDVILAGKKRKLLLKGKTDITLDKETVLKDEINKLPEVSPANILVHLPTEHHVRTEAVMVSLNNLRSDNLNTETFVRYVVFKNLWEQGYYITNGSKFGADFLVYPGDPVKFHATYMVRCIDSTKGYLRPANLVAFGRLAISVNKLAVLAYYSDGNVEFQTVNWHDSVNA